MSNSFDVLWLSTSPSLRSFDVPLISYLSSYVKMAFWEYNQTLDEASCIETAIALLYEFLKTRTEPVHLIGHGISGVVALMFARQYPNRVHTLTLLGVGCQPAATWHTYYYTRRQLLDASRQEVMTHTIRVLFGNRLPDTTHQLVIALNIDLDRSPSTHSLLNTMTLPKGGVHSPLMICGSKNDAIVTETDLDEWITWLKPGDLIWKCPAGYHFFHYFHHKQTGQEIIRFWQSHYPNITKD
jgi:pimeloyl-ACP methyl ester carboxylesterase